MCGIAGVVDKRGINTEILYQMSKILRHRGPDDEGYFISDFSHLESLKGEDTIKELSGLNHIAGSINKGHFKLGFVHRRLSIIDLEKTGHQPMQDERCRFVIVYNGEIYNYLELKEDLILKGYRFKSTSDTEVILNSFTEWGITCVERFVGMWAFAIYDNSENNIFLSRDRFGIKPLYYSFVNGIFAFASESKALVETGLIEPKADLDAALEYIAFGALADPDNNLYKDIQTLPPGTNIEYRIDEGKINQTCYYNLGSQIFHESNSNRNDNQLETFKVLFTNSVRIHLRSDVPVGSCLSGGLDSGSLVATASILSGFSPGNTFTASYPGTDIDEKPYVEKLAEKYKNINTKFCYPSFEKFWDDLDKIIWHQDYPFNSTSIYSQWEVMKLAKENRAKVLLDGQGADESLGGYSIFAGNFLIGLLTSFNLVKFIKEFHLLKQNLTPKIFEAITRSAYYYLPESIQKRFRNKQRAGSDLISKEFRHDKSLLRVPQRGGRTFTDLSVTSIKYGLSDLLRYEDRNSMAFSIESRVPFLDHRLLEYILNLETNMKINNGWTKYILRKAGESILPEEIVWRKGKLGFVTPQDHWRVSNEKKILKFLKDISIPPILNTEYFSSMVTYDLNSTSKISEFWKIISFIKWAEIFKVTF